VLAFVVPSMLGIKIAAVRPSTNAKIIILSPKPQQVLRGNPATVPVRLRDKLSTTSCSSRWRPTSGVNRVGSRSVISDGMYPPSACRGQPRPTP